MSTSPDEQRSGYSSASDIETMADQLVTFVEEFEAAIKEGYVPPEFVERLTQLREGAERLFGPK